MVVKTADHESQRESKLTADASPDLARINESWPALPTHIRAAILALLDAAER
jgi:hypothetical protein